ncbi:MAG: CBS domain-containing protein [Desulfobacter sp.]|nr:MAG: CBS domain-containing protein [Desulfobacter sp.]
MKARKVNELMIPLSDYATVLEDAFLADAIKALKTAQSDTKFQYKHRAILVLDPGNNVVGKLGIREILKALEPKYRQFEHSDDTASIGLSRFGFNMGFLSSLVDKLELWDETMEELVLKAGRLTVKDIMYSPSKAEYVDQTAPIAEAVHQFILGCHQSLLVLDGDVVVGILRLADIFDLVCDLIE